MPTDTFDISREDQEKIARAKQEWEHTFDAVPDLIYITDSSGTIIRANRALADRCGCTPMELVGRTCSDVIHDDMSPPCFCPHASMLESRQSQTVEFDSEKLHGTFEVTLSPVFDEQGQIAACVHVARDVTEKKRHEELLETQQKQLEEINSSLESRIETAVAELRNKDDILIQQSRLTAMGEMISNIAHQWRQPLNNIGLIVQSLQLAYKANDLGAEELDEDIAEIMTILQQISETIDDFRNFFSYEEIKRSFCINEIISHTLPFVEPSLKKKGIMITLEEEPGVTAEGYPNEYMQTLLNVIMNARDVVLEHHVSRPCISIRIFRDGGRSVVTVRDNGGGISDDILPKIYDPYFTTKQQGKGTGIGLYMAKMIIEKKMRGSLSARNVDDGTEFRIEV